jgi:hypothetical protein
MNPQPDPIVGNFVALIIIVLVAFYTYKAYLTGKSIDLNKLDNFVIGYIEAEPTTRVVEKHFQTINNPVKVVKEKTEIVRVETVIDTKPSFESQQLYVDCIDALYALGMKKNEAKKKAKFIFSTMNPAPATIQEFLIIAMSIPK